MRRALILLPLLAACNFDLGGPLSAEDFVGDDIAVTPGLASCATAIGRPDLATDPNAPMTVAEIDALLTCTASRARG
ncbi:hypothetical protein [Jannaschia seohaensis]|uniref:Uncharacterized protein n=1 Tax=Jannaschia seohaensis TaxID=475081 RepID=A0A2Y9A1F6_9RHOB|nr:hypothetical protein [Jannaschia seohaensis]PWJ22093.1 hypothetical protein BCF38_101502 [Jannaschia seohaensis]SSA38371.1 hypothetical protein SAMN05421539_101502 [Jannaschia seohaensis]